QGDRTHQPEWYLASAVYAYAFLFPGPSAPADERPGELDPRSRMAADLYNRGLTEAFASKDGSQVLLRAGVYPLPFGQPLAVPRPAASSSSFVSPSLSSAGPTGRCTTSSRWPSCASAVWERASGAPASALRWPRRRGPTTCSRVRRTISRPTPRYRSPRCCAS